MKTSGAEATISLNKDNNIDKCRIEKSYRIPEIDIPLRVSRTKKEVKILQKLQKIIPVPKIVNVKEFDIEMEFLDGTQLKKILDSKPELAELIGNNLSFMHDSNIIHGDLTTSNMILKVDVKENSQRLYFIDFGLSFVSGVFVV